MHKLAVIDALYKDKTDLEKEIINYSNNNAYKGKKRLVYK